MQVSIARQLCALLKRCSGHRLPTRAAAALSIVGIAGVPAVSQAAVLTVTSTADDGSAGTLRAVIQSAANGDTIEFSPTTFASYQTISLTQGPIAVAKDLTIVGPEAHVAFDAGHRSAVMSITPPCLEFSMSGVTIENGSALNGAGINIVTFRTSSSGGSIGESTLSNCSFVGCNATDEGGGLYADFSRITLNNCVFTANSAAFGGGLFDSFSEYTRLSANACAFYGNTASSGAGAYNDELATFTNCTFHNNTAFNMGGAVLGSGDLLSEGATHTNLINCTINANGAATGGGAAVTGKSCTFRNTIFYGDAGGEIYDPTGIVTANFCEVQGGFPGTSNIDSAPLLGPLADNGGPVPTMALFPGSPCIGAGTSVGAPPTDARGVSRPNPPCIGAYEYSSGPELTSVSPASIIAGGTNVILTVTGAAFIPTSVVVWNGIPLATTYVSPTELTAAVPDVDVASVGAAQVGVDNPTTGQQSSNMAVQIVADAVAGLSLSPDTVLGGKTSWATLTLAKPAPENGVAVSITSSDPQVAFARRDIEVPAGQSSVTFKVRTRPVANPTSLTISATLDGTVSATLTVTPPEARSLHIHPATVHSSGSATATLVLDGWTAVDTPVTVTVSNPAAISVNGPVVVPAGQNHTAFTLNILSVSTRETVTVSASTGTAIASASVTILPHRYGDGDGDGD